MFAASPSFEGTEGRMGDEQPTRTAGARAVPEIVLASLLGDGAEHASVGLYVYDDEGKYVAVNRYGAELLGYDRNDLLSRDVGDFTPGGLDRRVLLRQERREGVRTVRRKDGSEIVVAFLVAPTRVASLDFFLSVVWELDPDDPRVASAY